MFCSCFLYTFAIFFSHSSGLFQDFSVDFQISNCQQDNYELEKLSRLYFKKENIVTNFIFFSLDIIIKNRYIIYLLLFNQCLLIILFSYLALHFYY